MRAPTEATSKASKPSRPRWLYRKMVELLTLLVAVAIGLVLGFEVYGTAFVAGGSMEPTLREGDRIVVAKHSVDTPQIKRGDIVFVRWNDDPSGDPVVKRVVGLPGEGVVVQRGRVYINGQTLSEPYLKEREQIEHPVRYLLGADEFFVLGDNRNQSEDSRDHGPVSLNNVLGKAVCIVWPPSRAGKLH